MPKSRIQATATSLEQSLIRACLGYSVAKFTAVAVARTDPDPNLKNSQDISDRALRRANVFLAEAARIPAISATGLVAKARVLKLLVDQDLRFRETHNEETQGFLRSLAVDVDNVLREQRWAELKREK